MRRPSEKCPLGVLAFALLSAARTCSSPMPYLFRAVGFSSTRTPGSELPPTVTCPTPLTWASFCAMMVEAASYIWPLVRTGEVRASMKMGESAGFTFRYEGLLGRLDGRLPRAALIAACTSRAAASMSRFRSNCNVMLVEPKALDEVISVTPAILPNWRSSGVATEEAMVSGLAPGKPALTEIVGNSTCGRGDTGSSRYAAAPASVIATNMSVVATGFRMNGSEIFIDYSAEAATAATGILAAAGRLESRAANRSNQM